MERMQCAKSRITSMKLPNKEYILREGSVNFLNILDLKDSLIVGILQKNKLSRKTGSKECMSWHFSLVSLISNAFQLQKDMCLKHQIQKSFEQASFCSFTAPYICPDTPTQYLKKACHWGIQPMESSYFYWLLSQYFGTFKLCN